ncbi:Nuclear protein [Trichinella spiralis]|uniref:Nuclear protein n=1 Tax=Trichinella spiralis TaxID=6334 RepID=A0ABR3KBF5_TRISP
MNAAEPDHGPSKVPTASTRSYGSVSSECCPTFDIIPNHLQKYREPGTSVTSSSGLPAAVPASIRKDQFSH